MQFDSLEDCINAVEKLAKSEALTDVRALSESKREQINDVMRRTIEYLKKFTQLEELAQHTEFEKTKLDKKKIAIKIGLFFLNLKNMSQRTCDISPLRAEDTRTIATMVQACVKYLSTAEDLEFRAVIKLMHNIAQLINEIKFVFKKKGDQYTVIDFSVFNTLASRIKKNERYQNSEQDVIAMFVYLSKAISFEPNAGKVVDHNLLINIVRKLSGLDNINILTRVVHGLAVLPPDLKVLWDDSALNKSLLIILCKIYEFNAQLSEKFEMERDFPSLLDKHQWEEGVLIFMQEIAKKHSKDELEKLIESKRIQLYLEAPQNLAGPAEPAQNPPAVVPIPQVPAAEEKHKQIFDLIKAGQDVALCQLLGVKAERIDKLMQVEENIQASASEGTVNGQDSIATGSAPRTTDPEKELIADVVERFFSQTEENDLIELIQAARASDFVALLSACPYGRRDKIIRSERFKLVLLYIKEAEVSKISIYFNKLNSNIEQYTKTEIKKRTPDQAPVAAEDPGSNAGGRMDELLIDAEDGGVDQFVEAPVEPGDAGLSDQVLPWASTFMVASPRTFIPPARKNKRPLSPEKPYMNYMYDEYDILHILNALISSGKLGNHVWHVLKPTIMVLNPEQRRSHLAAESQLLLNLELVLPQYSNSPNIKLIIPILNAEEQWIGVVLDLRSQEATEVAYFNSAHYDKSDEESKTQPILQDIKTALKKRGFSIDELPEHFPCPVREKLNQPIAEACGVYLIENIRRSAVPSITSELFENKEEEHKSVREQHWSALKEQKKDFFPLFVTKNQSAKALNTSANHESGERPAKRQRTRQF